jgi:hypothetical protein
MTGTNTCIVPSCDRIISERKSFFHEEVELHEIVTVDIWIRRPSGFILMIYILDDPLLIFIPIIESIEGKFEIFCYSFRFFEIGKCRTGSWIFLIKIVDHKSTRHLMSLLSEEVCRDCRVDTSGKSDEDFHYFSSEVMISFQFLAL